MLPWKTAVTQFFLSTCGENEDKVLEELVKFLKYVKAGLKENSEDFQDNFVKRVQTAVRNVKASREMEEAVYVVGRADQRRTGAGAG